MRALCHKLMTIVSLFLMLLMLVNMLGACTKGNTGDTGDGGDVKSTTSSAKTTAKSTNTAGGTGATTARSSTQTATVNGKDDKGTDSERDAKDADMTEDREQGDDTGEEFDIANEDTGDTDVSEVEETRILDLKGREILVISNADEEVQIPKDNWGTRTGDVVYKLVKEAEEKFNCKFKFELVTNRNIIKSNFESSYMAGVVYADVIRLDSKVVLPAYENNGMVLVLNDYIDFSQPIYQKFPQLRGLKYPDNVYAFFSLTPLTPIGVWYRIDILDREGVADPQTLAAEGRWNWDTFLDIAINTTRDFDGDGIIDQYGVGANTAITLVRLMLRGNCTEQVAYDKATNKYVYNLESPATMRVINFISDLVHTYKVFNNGFITGIAGNTMFINGKQAMLVAEAYYGSNLRNAGMTNLGFELIPHGPDTPEKIFMRERAGHFFVYPSNINNPEEVIRAMEYWQVAYDETKSDYLTMDDLIAAQAVTYFDRPESAQRFIEIMREYTVMIDYVNCFDPASTILEEVVYTPLVRDNMMPMSAIESVKYQIQDLIDTAMGY